MAQQFTTLEDCLKFIEQIKSFGMEPNQDLLDEKARLEAAASVNDDEYIFGTMAANNKFMTPQKEKVVRELTEQLLSNGVNATQPCLLLGKVQCGKTDTFLSTMGLCFDRGIDIAIVMTKGTNTLTDQTLKRLNKDFRFFKDNGRYDQRVVITIYDILDLYKKGGLSDYQLNDASNKFIIVVKKEGTNLKYINELFERSTLMCSKRVLICDDEADFASRAYYKRKGELGLLRIGELIEDLTKKPQYCRYLQITATPYSLYLQPDGSIQLRNGEEASPWLPRYTALVPIHERYVGGHIYYVLSQDENSMYNHLYQTVTNKCNGILSAESDFYLKSNVHSNDLDPINYAVVSYLFSAAVRSIQVRNKSNKKYYSSCLIHCEIAQKNHEWQAKLITQIIEDVKNAILVQSNGDLHVLDLESDAYESLRISNQLGNNEGLINEQFPSFAEVEAEVKRILEYNDYTINVVNSVEPGKVETLLDEKGQLRLEQTLNFFIGGSILDRGITIDNMLCFFYGRDPKKFQMDTVLQHARMYGARDKEDMACTRFFTTKDIYDVLKTINDFDECLYDYLQSHRDSIQTEDITSIVIGYDKRVKASAQNKYTPANTRVIKKHDRILPRGFQTGTADEISNTIQKITDILSSCPDYTTVNESADDSFFLLSYEQAVEITRLISSTYLYAEEFNNIGYEWDNIEMLTALDYCTFDTDGLIYCQVFTDRNMSRERSNIYDKRGRFVDSPVSGAALSRARNIAVDRPVLMLILENGKVEDGWRGTPFYWPLLLLHENVKSGIFTINANKKDKKPNKQIRLKEADKHPQSEILAVPIKGPFLIDILAGLKDVEYRDIKETTKHLYLDRDEDGNFIFADGVEQRKRYSLSHKNGGVFPYKIRDYKYLYLRQSRDYSGSQIFVELKKNNPHTLFFKELENKDVVFNAQGEASENIETDLGQWFLGFNINRVLEYHLTKQDEEIFNQLMEDLQLEKESEK